MQQYEELTERNPPGPPTAEAVMPIRFRCVYCDKLLGISRRKAGAVVHCPGCAKQLKVPLPDSDEEEPPEPSGHIRNTSPGAVTGLALAGLVLGWLLRQVSINRFGHAPLVGWLPVFALQFA